MIRSSLVKSACVAIALSGFSPPQAGAIEMEGFNPAPMLNEGMISKAYIAHRGVTAVGPRGGVYHRGGTAVGGYRGGAIAAEFIVAAFTAAESTMAAGSTAAVTAAGRVPAGIAGDRAARLRPAPQSVCSQQELPRPMRALHPRQGCAGTIPIRAIATAFGMPASRQSNWGPIGAAESVARDSGASTRFSGRR